LFFTLIFAVLLHILAHATALTALHHRLGQAAIDISILNHCLPPAYRNM